MQLDNSFTVPAPIDQAWDVLLDVERIAPCMPGATLTENDGQSFGGTVKVKVGPIGVTYKGSATFVDRDDAGKTVTIDAKGRETRGSGTASATIKCAMVPEGDVTRVDVNTDLAITGKPAQFGRGVMGEIAQKIIGQFADCLSEEISAPAAAPQAEPATPAPAAEAAPTAGSDAGLAGEPAPVAGSVPSQAAAPIAAPTDARPAAPTATPTPVPAAAPSAAAPPASPPAAPAPRRSAEAIDLLDVAGAPALKRLGPLAAGVALLALLVSALRRRAARPTPAPAKRAVASRLGARPAPAPVKRAVVGRLGARPTSAVANRGRARRREAAPVHVRVRVRRR